MSEEKRAKIISLIRDTIREAEPTAQIILYGSRARGDAHEDSDYDLLLLLDKERVTNEDYNRYVYDLFLQGLDWDAEINTHIYPRHKWESWSFSPFYKNVEHDKIILL